MSHRFVLGLAATLLGCSAAGSINPGSSYGASAVDPASSGAAKADAGVDSGAQPSPLDGGNDKTDGPDATTVVTVATDAGLVLSVSPSVAHVAPNGTAQFTAMTSPSSAGAVRWTVDEGQSGGSISASGSYTAPSAAGTYHVTASFDTPGGAVSASAPVIVAAVGDCANLPAAGRWENISVPGTGAGDEGVFSKNFSEALVVDPFDPATVWLNIGYKGVFKSSDCGATWVHVNTGRNREAIDNGSHVSMAIDHTERGTMYLISIFSTWGLWKSTNGGVDWDQMFPADSEVMKATHGFADAISMDPTDHRHLVVGFHTNCEAPYAPTCVAETKDGGASWSVHKTPAPNWEEGAGPWVIGPNTWVYGGEQLYYTQDGGTSWRQVTASGTWGFSGGEVATHPIPRGKDGTYYLTSSQGVVRSKDGQSWTLIPSLQHRVVGFALAGGKLFASDQWSKSYFVASEDAPDAWSPLPPPSDAELPADQGAPYIDYDPVHRVVYTSNFAGGTWRTVAP
jgi:hypothetical protein